MQLPNLLNRAENFIKIITADAIRTESPMSRNERPLAQALQRGDLLAKAREMAQSLVN